MATQSPTRLSSLSWISAYRAAWVKVNWRLGLMLLAAALTALVTRLSFLQTNGALLSRAYFAEDALITLRYAQNLGAGQGLVYNADERVLGTTTPLYAIILAVPAALGADLVLPTVFFNLLLDLGIAALLVWVARGHPIFQVSAALLYLLHPNIQVWSMGGMEMSLFVFLALLTVWLFCQQRYVLAGVGAALVVLCRIDGVLLVGALGLLGVGVAMRQHQQKRPAQFLGAALIAFLPWLVFATLYYGSPVPQSAQAKQVWYVRGSLPRLEIWEFPPVDDLLLPVAALGLLLLVFNPRGDAGTMRQWLLAMALWFAALGLFFMVTRVVVQSWYRVPIQVLLVIGAAWGLDGLGQYLTAMARRRLLRLVATLGLSAMFLLVLLARGGTFNWISYAFEPFSLTREIYYLWGVPFPDASAPAETMYYQVGRWLKRHTEPGDTVYAGNIGFIGYYSERHILDGAGLVSPEALRIAVEDGLKRARIISTFRPEYLALERREVVELEPVIRELGYVQVAEFKFAVEAHPSSPYRVFARADKARGIRDRGAWGGQGSQKFESQRSRSAGSARKITNQPPKVSAAR